MAWERWDEIPSVPTATGAAPGWQHLPLSAPHSVRKHLVPAHRVLWAQKPWGAWGHAEQGQHVGHAAGRQQELFPRDTLPAHPRTLRGEVQHMWVGKYSLRHCSQANMVPIQHRRILKVKIVYCCLCRNALNLHRLFSSFIWLLDYRHKKVTFTHLFSDITPFSLLLHSWYSPKPCWPTAPNLFYINTVNVSIGCSIVTKDLPK